MKIFKYHFSKTKTIITLIGICISIYYMLIYKLDIRAITIITLLLGYITNVFVGVTSLIGLIPVIGPLIVNILTLPFIWIINGIGYSKFLTTTSIDKSFDDIYTDVVLAYLKPISGTDFI